VLFRSYAGVDFCCRLAHTGIVVTLFTNGVERASFPQLCLKNLTSKEKLYAWQKKKFWNFQVR